VSTPGSNTGTDGYGAPGWRAAVLVFLLSATMLVLPWVAPAVPRMLAGLVPDLGQPARAAEQSGPHADPGIWIPVQRRAPTAAPVQARGPVVRDAAAGVPARLHVGRLGVRSDVVPISGESGVLLPPSDPQLLGWWREGAVPGAARGTAVLTGHTVSVGGGAFDHLERLVRGDAIEVRTAKGTISYTVASTRAYSTQALARRSHDIFRLAGPSRLVLITCSGYDGQVYRSNTVVTAVPVG
jgi:LPXTG-site transpeptidase (sortase) family protein